MTGVRWETRPCSSTVLLGLCALLPLLAASCRPGALRADEGPYRLVTAWGSQGRADGEFSYPRAIRVSDEGFVYVIDKSGRVQKFTSDGQFVLKWELPDYASGKPDGLCVVPDDGVIIADTHYSRVLEYSPDGDLVTMFGTYGTQPGQFIYPTGVAVDSSGVLFVSEWGEHDRVQCFDRHGRFEAQWGEHGLTAGQFQRLMNLAINSRDEVFAADSCNHRVQVFSTDGTLLRTLGELGHEVGQLKFPYDVALDASDRLYVCEYGNHRVQQFGPEGQPLAQWGEPGSGPGQLSGPWGVAVGPDGRVYVADTGNHRVQVFGEHSPG